jgi:hypothetical protein
MDESDDESEDCFVMSCGTYIDKCLEQVEEILGHKLTEQSTPNINDWKHWERNSEPLDAIGQNKFQKLIGTANWLVTIGRCDILFATSTLSRYSANPTQQHMKDIVRVFSYLKKYRKRGIYIRGENLDIGVEEHDRVISKKDMLQYYPDAVDEWDPKWPRPKGKPVRVTIFVDADHGTNQVDRRSITGLIVFIGTTPIRWSSKRQSSIETSTYGAELAALRIAVEEAITTLHTLRSIGVNVQGPVRILADSKSAVDSTSIPGSVLRKRHSSIAYHKVRESVAAGMVDLYHVGSTNNVADVFTKPKGRPEFCRLLGTFMYGFEPTTRDGEDDSGSAASKQEE